MPASITPPPKEDEVECGRCGAYVHIDLTRCPNCGVNLYEPEDDGENRVSSPLDGAFAYKLKNAFRRAFGKPHPAEELFANALREKDRYDDLLHRVGGERAVVERLIEFEKQSRPDATRLICLERAILRWEQDNR